MEKQEDNLANSQGNTERTEFISSYHGRLASSRDYQESSINNENLSPCSTPSIPQLHSDDTPCGSKVDVRLPNLPPLSQFGIAMSTSALEPISTSSVSELLLPSQENSSKLVSSSSFSKDTPFISSEKREINSLENVSKGSSIYVSTPPLALAPPSSTSATANFSMLINDSENICHTLPSPALGPPLAATAARVEMLDTADIIRVDAPVLLSSAFRLIGEGENSSTTEGSSRPYCGVGTVFRTDTATSGGMELQFSPDEGGSTSPSNHLNMQFSSRLLLQRLMPVISQRDYLESDIRKIEKSSKFSWKVSETWFISVKYISTKKIKLLEPKEEWTTSFLRYGSAHENPDEPNLSPTSDWPVSVKDFVEAPFAFESIFLSLSVALWGTVWYHNDLVDALIADSVQDEKNASRENCNENQEYVVSVVSLFNWLSSKGIDVFVTSPGRSAAYFVPACILSSENCFCDKNCSQRISGEGESNDCPFPPLNCACKSRRERVLVVLVYAAESGLWSPATIARHIRVAVEKNKQWLKMSRKEHLKQKQKRLKILRLEHKKFRLQRRRKRWEKFCQQEPINPLKILESRENAQSHYLKEKKDSLRTSKNSLDIEKTLQVDVSTASSSEGPFEKMMYPNLQQADFDFFAVIGKVRHPWFRRACIRLVIGAVSGFFCLVMGLLLVFVMPQRMHWCVQRRERGQESICLSSTDYTASFLSNSSSSSSCVKSFYEASFSSKLVGAFFFGQEASVGKLLISAICISFFAIISGFLTTFFFVRSYAVGSTKRKFLYVYHGINLSLGVAIVGLVAGTMYWIVYLKVKKKTEIYCTFLSPMAQGQCLLLQKNCGDFRYAIFLIPRDEVTLLILSAVMLFFSLLQYVAFCIPLKANHKQKILTAIPDTYAFRPSPFSPDGLSISQQSVLRNSLYPTLYENLVEQNNDLNRLVSENKTVKEMVDATEQHKQNFRRHSNSGALKKKYGADNYRRRRKRKRMICRYHRSAPSHPSILSSCGVAEPYLGSQLQMQVENIANEIVEREEYSLHYA